MENYIPVARYTYEYEILVLRHLLEKEGIPHIFKNETAISILPFHSNALGGIILQVPEPFLSAAKQILSNLEDNSNHLRVVE